VDCPCGNNLYEAGYDEAVVNKVWRCSNCERETPRKTCHRSTNHLRAIKSYLALREAWKPVDAALDALVSAGLAQGGALLVHSSVFNYHLKQLVDFEKPSNFAVKYHTTQAQADMAKAKAFINERTVQETV
jgi:hypothetical protein